MAHKDRRGLVDVARREPLLERLVKQQPRRQADDAGNLNCGRQPGQDAHGAALREAADDDAVGSDAAVDLRLNQPVEVALRGDDAGSVLVVAEVGG